MFEDLANEFMLELIDNDHINVNNDTEKLLRIFGRWLDERAAQQRSMQRFAPHIDIPFEDGNSAHYRFVKS